MAEYLTKLRERLILFFFVGEVARFDVADIGLDGVGDDGVEVGVATQEMGREVLVDAQHVVHDEHLSVYSAAGADPDHGDTQLAGYACG